MGEQFSQLVEDNSEYVSQGKRKIGRKKYTYLRKTYDVISSGGIFTNYNYMFRIYKIKAISLLQHIKEKLQLKAGHLRNVAIDFHKFKNIPVYKFGGKCIQILFKDYNYALT